MLESHGRRREWREESVAVTQSEIRVLDRFLCNDSEGCVPKRAASLSFLRLLMEEALSASIISRSGRRRGSKTPEPPPGRRRIVPSRCRSFMWFRLTAYTMVPADGERIFHIAPPRVWPALNGVIVRPWHLPMVSLSGVFYGRGERERTLKVGWL